ncbi:Clp protease N-terminal domain-containing protein [Streptomyces sp. NPDC059373]
MFKQFATGARDTVTSALEETRQRGDRRISTEHLFLGLLHDPGSAATRALGVDLTAARAALGALDQAALAAIGIDVRGIELPAIPGSRKRTPFTSGARAVIERAVKETVRTHSKRTTPEHMLLALLDCERPDPAAELMRTLRIDPAAVRGRLSGPAQHPR